jgi:hypothetical protein
MTVTKLRFNYFWFAMLMVWSLSSCVSPEERLKDQFNMLPRLDSTLLYEYGATSSGATGDCIGVFEHRWYGTSTSNEDIAKFYTDYLNNNGWSIWSGEAVEIWSREQEDGLYRTGIDIFSDPKTISKEQGSYQLPTTVLLEASQHETVYLLSMTYMVPRVAKKCFGR